MKQKYYVADFESTTPRPTIYANYEHPEELVEIDDSAFAESPWAYWEDGNETRAWLFTGAPVLADPTSEDVEVGGGVWDFLDWIGSLPNSSVVYFHNLKFDVSFIIPALIELGYERDPMEKFMRADGKLSRRKNPAIHKFSALCSDTGAWYELRIRISEKKTIIVRDSLKLIPASVDDIAKDLRTTAKKLKGTINYEKERPVGYIPTQFEVDYAVNDVLVMSQALYRMFEQVPVLKESLTIGGAAMKEFYQTLSEVRFQELQDQGVTDLEEYGEKIDGRKIFRSLCPELDASWDAPLRAAYRGGWCRNQTTGEVIVNLGFTFDVNSLYSSVMHGHRYPVGYPRTMTPDTRLFFKSRTKAEYFVEFDADFVVKPGHVPFLQDRNGMFGEQAHIEDSGGVMRRTLCRPDFELFMEQYDVRSFEVVGYWTFDHIDGLFDRFVEKFYEMKNSNKVDGVVVNPVLYLFAKLMLNNLYGKMGQAPDRASGVPVLSEEGELRFISEPGDSKGGYIPIGAYITAYARCVTVRGAQAVIDAGGTFDYADTDSLHVHGIDLDEMWKILSVGDELGQWDHEATWDLARFVRQKTYVERVVSEKGSYLSIKACGAPEAVKERMLYRVTEGTEEGVVFNVLDWHFDEDGERVVDSERRPDEEVVERFTHGLKEAGKLMRKSVSGGTILNHTTFMIS